MDMDNTKHACMLPKPQDDLHPTATFRQRVRYFWQNCLLPCGWHHGSQVFIRSRKSLELEQQRQLDKGHGFIWHPYSPAKYYFDCFMSAVDAFAGLYVPLQVFLNCPDPANPFILAIDFFTFCDIIVNFFSGYNDEYNKEIVLDPKKIALDYLKGPFFIDLITAMPWQLYQPFPDCRYPSNTVFYPIKLLRYRPLLMKRESFIELLEVPYFCSVIFTVFMRLILFINWMTYWQYQVPAICVHYYELDNLGTAEAEWLYRLDVNPEVHPFKKYITNLFYVCGRCVGAGYALPVRNHVMPEMIQNSITSIVSLIFLIHCFMTVLRLVLCSQSNFIFDGAMNDLERYMTLKRLPKTLQNKIRLFINYKFGGSYMDENYILNTINDQIKQDINMHTCRRLVINVPLFKGFPMSLINTIIFSLKQEVCIPEQEVIKRGHPVNTMYFIYYGTVAFMDENGREVNQLNDGQHFGDAALIHPGEPAAYTVTALEITEIYALSNDDFTACIQYYPKIQQSLVANLRRSTTQLRSITNSNYGI